MKLRVLGCGGGIGANLRTTSFLLDGDVLIDAGTGVGDLTVEDMKRIDHVFLTHSHLDHVACLPLLVDTVGPMRKRPIVVHALAETLEILQEDLFNWRLWPDFSQVPNTRNPYLRYQPLQLGEAVTLRGRKIVAFAANHTVPAVGFHLDSGSASLAFSGDTSSNDEMWHYLNHVDNLRYLIIETAFPDEEKDVATLSKHLYPSLLAQELRKLDRRVEVYVTHLKPGAIARIMQQVEELATEFRPHMLQNCKIFEF